MHPKRTHSLLYLNRVYVNRLKAFTSVAVLGMSILAGLDKANPRTMVIVLCIS